VTAFDDTPANLRFRIGVLKINQRDGDARITLGVAAFDRIIVRYDKKTITFTPDPDGRAVGRAVSKQRGEMGEVAAINQANSAESLAGIMFSSGTLLCLHQEANLTRFFRQYEYPPEIAAQPEVGFWFRNPMACRVRALIFA
jgi:hypothetical protein